MASMFASLFGGAADKDAETEGASGAAGKKIFIDDAAAEEDAGARAAQENDNDEDDDEDDSADDEEKADVDDDDDDDGEDDAEPGPPPLRPEMSFASQSQEPPPLPPTDFDTERLVTALAELELAKTLLGRREDLLVMFRPDADLVQRASYANLKQSFMIPCTLFLLPCLWRGAQHQRRVGEAMYYVLTDKGVGTVVTRVDEDPWALPRSPGFDKVFIPWEDIVQVAATSRSESCAAMTTVEITYVKPVRPVARRSKRGRPEEVGEPESEKWMCKDPDAVVRQLQTYWQRFSPEGAQAGANMRHASLESLRSIKNAVDSLLPDEERDPKRLFVAETSDPDDAVIITLPPGASWSVFLNILEGALGHSLGTSPRIFVLKEGAHARVKDVHSLLHDDLVLVELS